MPTTHRNHQEAYSNIRFMQESVERLLIASKDWKPDDAVRGEATLIRLDKQIERAKAEMLASR